MSVQQQDFWTAGGLSGLDHVRRVGGLDNGLPPAFEVGNAQRDWLTNDLAAVPRSTPLIVCSHSPLYKLYRPWNFWTKDAEAVQAILRPFERVTVLHAHTHQPTHHAIGNIQFYGMLSTAWPWPYSPHGLPTLTTLRPARDERRDRIAGSGHGRMIVHPDRQIEQLNTLWRRNPTQI